MRKLLTSLTCISFVVAPLFAEVSSAADQTKDDDLSRRVAVPPAAKQLVSILDDKTPKHKQ